MEMVKRSDDSEAAQALQKIADILRRPSLENLIESLKDQRYDIRKVAAFALGEMGEAAKAAIPALIGAIKDAWGPNPCETDVGWRAPKHLGISAQLLFLPSSRF
jgi:HEAT repeat protein